MISCTPFRTLNVILCVVHLSLGIGFMVYFSKIQCKISSPIDLTVRSHRLVNQGSYESQPVQTPSLQAVEVMAVLFFFITAFFHAVYAITSGSVYKTMLFERKNNFLRWIEYGITSTLMIYILAMMSGVKDVNTYIFLGTVNVAMIAQGQAIEKHLAQGTSPFIPYFTGFLLLFTEIAVISREFQQRVQETSDLTGRRIPSWLPSMIYILFIMYSLFGLISLMGGLFKIRYTRIEACYLWLSLISKALLGSFLAYGLGKRSTQNTYDTK